MLQFRPRTNLQHGRRKLALISALPLAFLYTGCGNSCFTFISNPGGAIGGSGFSSACPAPTQHATVHAVAHVTRDCESCSDSNRIQNVFVTLRGIELHPRANAGEEPSDWQELLPLLAIQPRQLDLQVAAPNGLAVNHPGEQATTPAGTYDLVRLRFAVSREGAGDLLASDNACGNVGLNCVAMGDGRILPLVLPGDVLDLPIASETTSNRIFLVLPETENRLRIQLTPVWALVTPPGQSAQLLPVLTGSARKSSMD
jgi:uncharacterized protein DUF4382